MTPMTAGGICELLFEKDNGLVPRHNVACEEEGKRIGKPENGGGCGKRPPHEDAPSYGRRSSASAAPIPRTLVVSYGSCSARSLWMRHAARMT